MAPRNGSGTYSIPSTVVLGTTINSAVENANNDDIASALTGSLPRNGEAGMTGQFKAASGTVAEPGITFGSDLDCGFYRIGADNIGGAVAGAKVLDISASGLGVTGALTKSGVSVEAFASGTVMLFVQTAAPTGWTKGSTHNDKALRLVTGAAGTGGSTAFTTVFAARTIAQANLPNVNLSSASLSASTTLSGVTNLIVGGNSSAPGGGNHAGTSLSTPTASTTISGFVPLGGSGTAMDFAVNYVDVILATKD
jgi:hypothetical protein